MVQTCDVKHGVGHADRHEENRGFRMCGKEKKSSTENVSLLVK